MDLRFLVSHGLAKVTHTAIKKISRGGATAAPGLLALYVDQNILQKLAVNLETTTLVTGTNGKTTTARLIGNFLDLQKINYLNNRHGSNLERGLISAFSSQTDFRGETNTKTALFEVDEAALANVLPKLNPQTIVITNLFRDQLDRYGEVDNIRRLWEKCLEKLDEKTTLVLNADDPSLAFLGKKSSCRVVYFGLNDKTAGLKETPEAVDSIKCPNCRADLKYETYFISHQGQYACPTCHFKRPELDIFAEKISFDNKGLEFTLSDGQEIKLNLECSLPGLFNVYNILASYAALKNQNSNLDQFAVMVKKFKPAFGRAESLEIDGKKILVTLAKNPTGFNEIIRTFFKKDGQNILIAVNDLIADGRDVSWLWDVDFETISDQENNYFVSGVRASDMALRLKYASIKSVETEENLTNSLESALIKTKPGETLLVIPTYTAMMSLKKILAQKGLGGEFWED